MNKRKGVLLDMEGERAHQTCSFMLADNIQILSHSKETSEQTLRDGRHDFGHHIGELQILLFEIEFRILGCAMNRQGKMYDAVEERLQSLTKSSGNIFSCTK